MGDDDHGGLALLVDLLEGLGQPGEAPQVDAGLRLVEDHQLAVPGQHGGDLDALDLAAGQADVHLAVEIIVGAEADLAEVAQHLSLLSFSFPAARQQVVDRDALEARRLLEGVADAAAGALGDGQVGDVLAVKQDRPLVGCTRPMMILARVVLPPPLGPVMATKRPGPSG